MVEPTIEELERRLRVHGVRITIRRVDNGRTLVPKVGPFSPRGFIGMVFVVISLINR
jgi:hypothetical protein